MNDSLLQRARDLVGEGSLLEIPTATLGALREFPQDLKDDVELAWLHFRRGVAHWDRDSLWATEGQLRDAVCQCLVGFDYLRQEAKKGPSASETMAEFAVTLRKTARSVYVYSDGFSQVRE